MPKPLDFNLINSMITMEQDSKMMMPMQTLIIHEDLPTNLLDSKRFFAPIWPLIGPKLWVAGGSVNRWLEGRQSNPADFDLFSADPTAMNLKLKEVAKLSGGDLVRESFLAYTYEIGGKAVQLIKRSYPDIQDVLRSFDFTARMAGTDGKFLYAHSDTRKDIIDKRIRFHQGDFSITITSLYGIVKYGNRGYQLNHSDAEQFMRSWGVPKQNLTTGYTGEIPTAVQ